ncbi:hypothetical protein BDV34DRAFT_36896 [Aspergillus parasiticus]|uniref:Uncharacterized protein n=1 Tax=Aspergillus parasiticus TaxID=5067 RepID=A0A5N6D2J8_ASPPA|nr:hypothetical protein BDV34DRAFT_36896 [Aspergillus parasiticus]
MKRPRWGVGTISCKREKFNSREKVANSDDMALLTMVLWRVTAPTPEASCLLVCFGISASTVVIPRSFTALGRVRSSAERSTWGKNKLEVRDRRI